MFMVPEVGLEPTYPCGYSLLKTACLPFHHSGKRGVNEFASARQRRISGLKREALTFYHLKLRKVRLDCINIQSSLLREKNDDIFVLSAIFQYYTHANLLPFPTRFFLYRDSCLLTSKIPAKP